MDKPSSETVDVLLASVRKRYRKLLRSQIRDANQSWSDAAHAAFFTARDAAGRPEAIRRDAFHHVYDTALTGAQATAETIICAAFRAGASDQQIEAYVIHNFQRSVDAFMSSCFGHGASGESAAGMRRQLHGLAGNTAAKARRLGDRVVILRDDFERQRPKRYDRVTAWCKQNPVAAAVMIIAAVLTPALAWVGAAEKIVKLFPDGSSTRPQPAVSSPAKP